MFLKSSKRVAIIFTANGSGLGHISRACKLGKALARDNWSVLIVSGNPAASYLAYGQGVDVIRIPCLEKSKSGERTPRTNYSDLANVLRLRKSLLLTLAIECRPSLLIVDHKPVGIAGELLDTLLELQKRNVPRVLVLRDFGGDPAIVKATWDEDDAWSALELYNQIIIVGDKSAYDWADVIGTSEAIPPLSYVGFLVGNYGRSQHQRRRKGSLVLGGGGAHAYELFLKIANDLNFLLPRPVEICAGPLMAPAERNKLAASVTSRDTTIKEYIPSLEHQLSRFEIIISQAGSISTELASVAVCTVLVPRNQKSREQEMRARYWSQTGSNIHLSDLNGLRERLITLGKNIDSNSQLVSLREKLPNLFVTAEDVVKSILNEL